MRPFLYLMVFHVYAAMQAAEVGQLLTIARIYADAPYAEARRIIAPEQDFTFTDPDVILSERVARHRNLKRPSLWCATIEHAQIFGSLQIASVACSWSLNRRRTHSSASSPDSTSS